MKAEIEECEGCFSIQLTAETVGEAMALVRFGMNRKGGVGSCCTMADKDTARTFIAFGKRKDATPLINQKH